MRARATLSAQVLLLFALKIMYPARILLVRGNHEFRSQSEYMGEEGFRAAVERLLPSPRHSHRVFEAVSARCAARGARAVYTAESHRATSPDCARQR